MTLVVDASVAIKWFVEESFHEAAVDLFRLREEIAAPDLLICEVANIAWKKAVRGEIENRQAATIVTGIVELHIEFFPAGTIVMGALSSALKRKHPVYDALYLSLADQLGATLVTADRALYSFARDENLRARLLGAT